MIYRGFVIIRDNNFMFCVIDYNGHILYRDKNRADCIKYIDNFLNKNN